MLNLENQSYKLFLKVLCLLPILPTHVMTTFLFSVYSLHHVTDFRKGPVIYLTNTDSELWMFCVLGYLGGTAKQLHHSSRGWRVKGWPQTGGSALHPSFALSSCLYFELSVCSFLGWKATAPKPAQKLWLFLSAFGTRHTFRLVLHISQIWSHHHQEDTSSHWGVQSSSMAEPDNERQMYSCWEGFPSLP